MSEESPPREHRQRLFHRLVGALVLGALAIILIPMILDYRIDQETALSRSNIPERPEGFRVEEIPLVAPPVGAPRAPDERSPEAVARSPEDSETAPAPATATAAGNGAAPPHAWVVRVGSFSSAENALALRDQLRAKGFSAFVDQVVVDGKAMSRVQVGPARQREQGEELRDRIARDMKLEGIVVGYE